MPTPRSLAPREHGAYGQLAFPLLTALAVGAPGSVAFLLTGAMVCAFLAHEPALVALGHRGKRALEEDGARARARLLLLGLLTVALLAGALVVGEAATLLWLLLPAAGLLPLGVLIAQRREKTAAGELLAVATLAAGAVPIAVASELDLPRSFTIFAAWGSGFAVATLAVRAVIADAKYGARVLRAATVLVAAIAAGALWGLARIDALHPAGLLAFAPFALASVALAARCPHPRHLRRVGWALMVVSVLALLALILEI